ncbi:MAG: GGDEF domain-containing protein [Candidatus Moraniibacteriota bacterium]
MGIVQRYLKAFQIILSYGPDAVSVEDQLTGFLNRRVFDELIKSEARQADIQDRSFIIILADVDDLKWVNDNLGHEKGDEVIQETANFLRKSCRSTDLFCRYGGDEFLICLTRIKKEKVDKIKEMMYIFLSSPKEVSFSFGIAIWRKGCTIENLIKEADKKMYKQKKLKKEKKRNGRIVGAK